MTGTSAPPLTAVLADNKRDFLQALHGDAPLDHWVIVMGNEAGDLDSIASAVGFSYFSSAISNPSTPGDLRYIPLYQAESDDLVLRPENALAFSESGISHKQHILFLDELQLRIDTLSQRGIKYALVDHNRLTARFRGDESSVVAIIDHHQDEGLYRSANPRWIQVPTGSCSSMVAEYFHTKHSIDSIPSELADLLISAIVIDTDNVKPAPKGKAEQTDLDAVQWLVQQSSAISQSTISTLAVGEDGPTSQEKIIKGWLETKTKSLKTKKFDLSALNSRDILRRDYKEYESDVQHWRYGLATCPLALKEWLERDEIHGDWNALLQKMEGWGAERELDVVGALTSYVMGEDERITHSVDGIKKKGRELLFLVRNRREGAVGTLDRAFKHFEVDEVLKVGPLRLGEPRASGEWQGRVFAYQQNNAEATRKQVAPAMKAAIESIEG